MANKKFPKYVRTYDGYIGTFQYLDFGEFPVYRFPGGDRIADDWEIEHGSDDRKALETETKEITETSDHIRIPGHTGTWYVIDHGWYLYTPDEWTIPKTHRIHCFLLEHEEYGDEAACLIVDQSGTVILDDVYNGFDDLLEAGWRKEA